MSSVPDRVRSSLAIPSRWHVGEFLQRQGIMVVRSLYERRTKTRVGSVAHSIVWESRNRLSDLTPLRDLIETRDAGGNLGVHQAFCAYVAFLANRFPSDMAEIGLFRQPSQVRLPTACLLERRSLGSFPPPCDFTIAFSMRTDKSPSAFSVGTTRVLTFRSRRDCPWRDAAIRAVNCAESYAASFSISVLMAPRAGSVTVPCSITVKYFRAVVRSLRCRAASAAMYTAN